ncbi:MAG: hypothetical protein Q9219_002804 [cf. Caloplaca sp. 3 TL-2023]
MTNATVIRCSNLASRTDFSSYIAAVRATTGDDLSLISSCKAEICDALWGSGNPDISGIGVSLRLEGKRAISSNSSPMQMILGYILSNTLGFLFTSALFLIPQSSRISKKTGQRQMSIDRLSYALARGCSSFYDSAIFFSFSIQMASIVMLARLDFGVSASEMGDSTAKITWAVSMLTLLPLMYVAYTPQLLQCPSSEEQSTKNDAKQNLRFGLFSLCWLLSMYPFYSKMVGYFGPSLIGNGTKQVIADDEWNIVPAMCTAHTKDISSEELVGIKCFGVSGSVFVCICALLKVIWLALQRQHTKSYLIHWIRSHQVDLGSKISVTFLTLLPIFAISQIWTILKLRRFQAEISNITGNVDLDSRWTFSQIAAVTLFTPVLIECWFHWRYWKIE